MLEYSRILLVKVNSMGSKFKAYYENALATFSPDYDYGIEYEYDFRILNPSRFQNRRSSLLLINRKGCSRNNPGVLYIILKHVNKI